MTAKVKLKVIFRTLHLSFNCQILTNDYFLILFLSKFVSLKQKTTHERIITHKSWNSRKPF